MFSYHSKTATPSATIAIKLSDTTAATSGTMDFSSASEDRCDVKLCVVFSGGTVVVISENAFSIHRNTGSIPL